VLPSDTPDEIVDDLEIPTVPKGESVPEPAPSSDETLTPSSEDPAPTAPPIPTPPLGPIPFPSSDAEPEDGKRKQSATG
jgi:hypothetical protein